MARPGTGLFTGEGLDANLLLTRGGSEAMQALVGGSTQFSMAGASTVVEAKLAGSDLSLIATSVPSMTSQIVVPRAPYVSEEGLQTAIEDLQGRRRHRQPFRQ